ncbi:MAG: metallophosphoesterase [Bacteroidota bacterium]
MDIVLITDLHVCKEGEDSYGVDVRKNFLCILEAIKKEQADYLIVNGDLCLNQGEVDIYKWIKHHLDESSIPYYLTVGNHDDGQMMADIFGLKQCFKNDSLYFSQLFGNWKGIFLDTSPRFVSKEQLIWLEEELQSTEQPIIIFMHHPPIVSGVKFMDENHALHNMKEVQEILTKDSRSIPIFSGHYHVDKTVCMNNLTLQITPSCYIQIAQTPPTFTVDHYNIAYRKIKLLKGGWKSTVRYLEGNKL